MLLINIPLVFSNNHDVLVLVFEFHFHLWAGDSNARGQTCLDSAGPQHGLPSAPVHPLLLRLTISDISSIRHPGIAGGSVS